MVSPSRVKSAMLHGCSIFALRVFRLFIVELNIGACVLESIEQV